MQAFILDVDGVLTTGQFFYTSEGKVMKVFGPDDNDGLAMLKPFIKIRFITADQRGLPITRKRIQDDMGYDLDLVSTSDRIGWISSRYDLDNVIYMGDGIFDHYVMRCVGYSIATSTSDPVTQSCADFVTKRAGGERAVAEASLHLLDKFFESYDPEK